MAAGVTMSARATIRPALERVNVLLRARKYPVDVALLRALRDFGLECYELGLQAGSVHTARTVPAPQRDDEPEITWTHED
jgi:hypothetical protein